MSIVLNAIKAGILKSGKTRYRISKDTGIGQPQLSRFMGGTRGMSIEAIERLADYLGLEIIIRRKRKRKG